LKRDWWETERINLTWNKSMGVWLYNMCH